MQIPAGIILSTRNVRLGVDNGVAVVLPEVDQSSSQRSDNSKSSLGHRTGRDSSNHSSATAAHQDQEGAERFAISSSFSGDDGATLQPFEPFLLRAGNSNAHADAELALALTLLGEL